MADLTFGEKAADNLSKWVGSWTFVIGQSIFLAAWFTLNSVAWFYHWDNYPFILANLFMSAEAALTAPIIMMTQNRSSASDREVLHKDYLEDQETNKIVEAIAKKFGVDLNEVQ